MSLKPVAPAMARRYSRFGALLFRGYAAFTILMLWSLDFGGEGPGSMFASGISLIPYYLIAGALDLPSPPESLISDFAFEYFMVMPIMLIGLYLIGAGTSWTVRRVFFESDMASRRNPRGYPEDA
jgi:hypothetical protein